MLETAEELRSLQDLLVRSAAAANPHLTSIISPGRRMGVARLVAEATGIAVLAVASVTARGEPRISAVDGHFRHGTWWFSTARSAAKVRQWRARPAISAAWTPRDGLGVFTHGDVQFPAGDDPRTIEFHDYLTRLYGMDPAQLSPDGIAYLRIEPSWMIGFAADDLVSGPDAAPSDAAAPA